MQLKKNKPHKNPRMSPDRELVAMKNKADTINNTQPQSWHFLSSRLIDSGLLGMNTYAICEI